MNFLNLKLVSRFTSFHSKSLIEIAKLNFEVAKIMPMADMMRQSAGNRSETSNFLIYHENIIGNNIIAVRNFEKFYKIFALYKDSLSKIRSLRSTQKDFYSEFLIFILFIKIN